MKKHYHNVHPNIFTVKGLNQSCEGFHVFILIAVFVSFIPVVSFSQGVIPTKGKDFWMAFPYAPYQISGNQASKRCDVFITSDISTTGFISIPTQGWLQPFSVTAYQTTTINIPVNMVEHVTSEIIENKGVQVVTQDPVSVFAISFQQVSADGTVVYPKQSLGTEYRISAYKGINYSPLPKLNSDFLIVAGEDGTQISITPTAPTLGGHAAGIPFIINLNAGESYQVIAATYSDDFTGTVIESTDSSGSCRPFAVFSGSVCVNIPAGCTACDVLYDQAIPVPNWGKTYYAVPFSFATGYTLRIVADQNSTSYTIDGGPATILNAGQYTEINNITGSRCINANKPVSVVQYMQGVTCSGAGDPSMMYLNAQEQKIDKVTFSTVTSTVINQHDVNVIMNTSHISQLTLDGNPVPSSAFTAMSYCNSISYAQLSLTQGSHTLAADSGFMAYAYGTGNAESYAYSVGSFSKSQPIILDSILCTSDTVNLGTTDPLFGIWWSVNGNPNDTIGTGPTLTLYPPIIPDVYVEHGFEYISGCAKDYYFNVEIPLPPQTWVTKSADTVCQNQQVQLNAGTIPASSIYQYSWTPVTGLSNPNIANPVATVAASMWYVVAVSSPNGCANTVYDSIYINVLPLPLPTANAGGNQSICPGASATLSASGGITYLWSPGGDTLNTITVSPTATTNYIVYVTDTNGCGNSDTVSVILNPVPNAYAGINQTICMGANAILTASGGGSYLWNTGSPSSSIIVSPTSLTSYVVQVTGANGCTKNDTVAVAVNPLPIPNAGADTVICSGSPLTLSASGGTSYLWTPGGNTTSSVSVSPAASTNYIVKVTDANGCQGYDTVHVTVNSKPVANAGLDQTICAGSSASLTAVGGVYYLWNPTGSTSNSITVSPASGTNYILTASDSIGCWDTDTVFVAVNTIAANAGSDVTICEGDSAILNATPSGSFYLWTPTGSTNASITVFPASTTNYILEVSDAIGCKDTDTVQVTVNPAVAANAGADQTICNGAQAILSANGGVSYLWAPGGSTTSGIAVSPALTTNYIVEVTDANGCHDYDTVLITVNPIPVANAGPDQAICSGANATLIASGGAFYLWSQGGNTTNSIIVSPTSGTNYMVLVSDSIGCGDTDTVHVTVNPLPAANAGPDVAICYGGSFTLIGTPLGASYLWTPSGSTSASITISPTTTINYILEVTDGVGCRNNDTVQIIVNPAAVANAGADQTICSGFQATLSATGGVSYLWTPGGGTTNSITVSPTTSTNYIVKVTDANGCQDDDTVLVNVNPFVTGASSAQSICVGSSTTLSASGGISYLWTPGGSTSDSITVSPQTSIAYFVHIVAANGCQINDTVNVTVNALPPANAGVDKAICIGSNATLFASGGISYLWTTTGSTSNSIVVSPVSATDYIVKVTDNNGCQNYDTVHVAVNPLPLANAGIDQLICPGTSATLTASGGTSYLWNPGGSTSISIIVSPLTPTNYFAQVTDTNGCQNTDTISVSFNAVPVAGFNLLSPVCQNANLNFVNSSTISSGAIVSNNWSFGDNSNSILASPIHSYSQAGSYPVKLIVTSDNSCIDSIIRSIIISPEPVTDFSVENACAMQPVQFNDNSTIGSGSISLWFWDFGDSSNETMQHPIHLYSHPGLYDITLTVTSDSGCAATRIKAQAVEIYPLPEADFEKAPDIISIMDPIVQFIDQSSGGIIWQWNFGDNNGTSVLQSPVYVYNDTGSFQVQMILTNSYGCADTAYNEVHIDPYFTFYIPSAFTPNGDGRNDFFGPLGSDMNDFEMLIFDRWGNKIFQTNNLSYPWNGKVEGSEMLCNEGVYVYLVKVADYRTLKHEYVGKINLIR